MNTPIKVGLLLDGLSVASWQSEIIKFIDESPLYVIELIIINSSPKRKSSSNTSLYRAFRKVERAFFRFNPDCFGRVDMSKLLEGIDSIKVTPHQTRYRDEVSLQDVVLIKAKKLDIMIRFGFRVLTGEILNAAKFGIWSLHHADSTVNRGGPPAFWEVVNKDPVTGVTLQRLSETLDGGIVLATAFCRTDLTSFNRNQNKVFWAGVELFISTLQSFPDSPFNSDNRPSRFYSFPLYRDPRNLQMVRIVLSFVTRRVGDVFRKMFKQKRWRILYSFNSESRSLYKFKELAPPSNTEWADPFIARSDGNYYMFFEELVSTEGKAHISCLTFDSNGKAVAGKPAKVLEEPHHLSYPFVFRHNENYYMVPESSEAGKVCLYRAVNFPTNWKLEKVLLNESVYDPTIVFHQGMWYLFGTQKPLIGSSPHQYLFIYFSATLSGDWYPHKKNPVIRDVRSARPAGRIFIDGEKLIRPSQIGAPVYGYGIGFHEITNLTPDEYSERLVDEIRPHWKGDLVASHTFNKCDKMVVIDGQFE